jgi:hypothetical protein
MVFLDECSLIFQWVHTVGLEELLTTIIIDSFKPHSLDRVRALDEADIQGLCITFLQELPALLKESVSKLKTSLEVDNKYLCPNNVLSKFSVFPYNSGRIVDFHAGLAGRLGKNISFKRSLYFLPN